MSAASIAIIGAGYAGMAAAVTLADAGCRVHVYESNRVTGGRARRVVLGGRHLDNGQHILIGAYSQCLRLIGRVGVNAEQALLRLPLTLVYPARFSLRAGKLPAPLHLALAVASATGVTWGERIAATQFMLSMRRRRFRLDRDVTTSALLDGFKRLGAFRDLVFEPLCVAALNTGPETASAQIFLNVLRDTLDGTRTDSDLLVPRLDLAELFPEPAARYIEEFSSEVRRGRMVRTIETDSARGFRLGLSGLSETYRQVIVAVSPHQTDRLLAGVPTAASSLAQCRALEFERICTVYMQFPGQVQASHAMLGLTDGPGQWLFDRGLLGGAPGMFAIVISAAARDIGQDDALLVAVRKQLLSHFPNLPLPSWHQVIVEKRATFSCRPHLVRPATRTDQPNLYLAGDYTASDYPATLESAVRSGIAAAQSALADRPALADGRM